MDTAAEARKAALRAEADRTILDPLRTHGWTAVVARVVATDDGHLIIDAVRGGKKHRIALLQRVVTENALYHALAAEVEHIFIIGDLTGIEEHRRGAKVPIGSINDFFDTLLKWNAETLEGAFVIADDGVSPPVARDHRTIQSEGPIKEIWARLRQLQSVALARKAVRARAAASNKNADNATVNGRAEGLAFAVRNASDYYRLRDEDSVSQRVLNLYYGTLSLAFAEMLASSAGPSALAEIEEVTKQGHGLYTVDGSTDGIDQLVVGVIASGFFPRWLQFLGKPVKELPTKKPRSHADLAKQPLTTYVTIEQLFARVPDLGELFADIFDAPPSWIQPVYDAVANKGAAPQAGSPSHSTYLRVVDTTGRIVKADLTSLCPAFKEIVDLSSDAPGRHFRVRIDHEGKKEWHDALPLHLTPFTPGANGCLIRPLFGTVTEFRVMAFALLYGLSIVVRYRPSIWRRVQEGDLDQFKVLIESFLAVVERVLPEQFLTSILGVPVHVRQPGALR